MCLSSHPTGVKNCTSIPYNIPYPYAVGGVRFSEGKNVILNEAKAGRVVTIVLQLLSIALYVVEFKVL